MSREPEPTPAEVRSDDPMERYLRARARERAIARIKEIAAETIALQAECRIISATYDRLERPAR